MFFFFFCLFSWLFYLSHFFFFFGFFMFSVFSILLLLCYIWELSHTFEKIIFFSSFFLLVQMSFLKKIIFFFLLDDIYILQGYMYTPPPTSIVSLHSILHYLPLLLTERYFPSVYAKKSFLNFFCYFLKYRLFFILLHYVALEYSQPLLY